MSPPSPTPMRRIYPRGTYPGIVARISTTFLSPALYREIETNSSSRWSLVVSSLLPDRATHSAFLISYSRSDYCDRSLFIIIQFSLVSSSPEKMWNFWSLCYLYYIHQIKNRSFYFFLWMHQSLRFICIGCRTLNGKLLFFFYVFLYFCIFPAADSLGRFECAKYFLYGQRG